LSPEESPTTTLTDRIRSAILEGGFAPRQRLIEADLCEQFDASRFQIRTALQDLASQGLVEFQHNRGARVRDVSLREAIEITEVRMLLEGHEAARAAQRVTPAQAAELRQLAMDMRGAVENGELVRYSELNATLHATLREISGHTIAAQLLEQLRGLTVRHQFTLSLVPGRSAVSLPQHEAIVAAVVNHDAVAAERAMHDHLRSVIEAFTAFADASAS
jgi:DNA-binding GntR family transcriptional regulator